MTKVFFVGGGTVGHIAPSVAVWEALKQKQPDLQAHFVCSPRPHDRQFLEAQSLPYSISHAPRLSLSFLWKFWPSVAEAQRLLNEHQPAVIFSKGGYVSVPTALAAHWRKIPIILHESDVSGGHANRVVSRWASAVCTGFPTETGNADFTGNPIRPDVTQGNRDEGLRITGLSGQKPVLLVWGASQGAQALNDAVAAQLDALLEHVDIVHITGEGKATVHEPRAGYYACPFANEELPHLHAIADLALSRAGASSIAELAANGTPAILVPLRGVARDHQQHNAQRAAQSGGCVVLQQDELDTTLLSTVKDIATSNEQRVTMSSAIKSLHHPDAAGRIAQIIMKHLAEAASSH